MKKTLFALYSIVTLFSLFYGGILMLVNIGRSDCLYFLPIFLVGLALLILLALYLAHEKKTHKDEGEQSQTSRKE